MFPAETNEKARRPGKETLRHTCAALFIAQDAHPKAIQRHLGHSKITVTLDNYGHLLPQEMDRLEEGLDATFHASLAGYARPERGLTLEPRSTAQRENRL